MKSGEAPLTPPRGSIGAHDKPVWIQPCFNTRLNQPLKSFTQVVPMPYANLQALRSAAVVAIAKAAAKSVAVAAPATDYRAVVDGLYADAAAIFSDELPSLGDIFYSFDRLVEVVAQLDVNDPRNWVVNPAKVAALVK